MYKISEFVKNIQENGNCKVYIPNDGTSNWVVKYLVDEKGALNVSGIIETYNGAFWNGLVKNENVTLTDEIKAFDYKKEDIESAIATIITASLNNKNNNILLTTEEDTTRYKGEYNVDYLCCKIKSMLSLSYYDLTQWVLGGENSVINNMLSKPLVKAESVLYNPDLAVEYIEMLTKKIDYYLNIVRYNWDVISSSATRSDAYKEASGNWATFCKSKKLLK